MINVISIWSSIVSGCCLKAVDGGKKQEQNNERTSDRILLGMITVEDQGVIRS